MDGITAEPMGSAKASERRARVGWLDRALPILDHLAKVGCPQTAYAIARSVGAPLSTTYGVIDDLVASDMLMRQPDGTLWLGSRLHRYGLAYAHSLEFLNVATQEAALLASSVQETVQICGRDGDDMVVLTNVDAPGPYGISCRVGARVPLNWTASGRLLLGHLPEEERIAVFARSAQKSPSGVADLDPNILAQQSRAALDAGLAILDGIAAHMVACVAAPICNDQGACVATISIVVSTPRLAADSEKYIDAVRAAASKIQTNLGWGTH
jgi:DNA-binding IclR family transcriptional regulator